MLESIFSATGVTAGELAICTAVSVVLGVLAALAFTYKNTCSKSFAVTLALLPVMVQAVIMLVNGNLGVGVAVLGSFSLVRFRSAPGNAREIAAVFLTVAIGLAAGMGYIAYAVIVFAVVCAMNLLLSRLRFGEQAAAERELKVTIPESLDYEGIFDDLFEKYASRCELVRVKTTNLGSMYELCYRITLKTGEVIPKEFLDELRCRNGNLNISCSRVIQSDAQL